METTGQQIAVACSSCGKKYQLPLTARGKSAKCGCGHRFVVEPAAGAQSVAETATVQNEDTTVVGAPPCSNHPLESAVAICVKCDAPICKQCALRTKSGKHVCRPCAQKHAAPKPAPPASDMFPPSPQAPSPEPEVEEITDAMVIDEPASSQISPGANAIEDFLSQQLNTPASDDLFQEIVAAPTMPDAPSAGYGNSYVASTYQAPTVVGTCAQHPSSPVVASCAICNKPVCNTCLFVFPQNMKCCPECAAKTDYPISPLRKIMIHASLGCAIFATLMMALLCSGLLSFLGETVIADVMLDVIIVLPLCMGVGLGFGSWNSQEGNPAMLWVGGIWNSLGLVAWFAFLVILVIGNLAAG